MEVMKKRVRLLVAVRDQHLSKPGWFTSKELAVIRKLSARIRNGMPGIASRPGGPCFHTKKYG